MAAKFDPDANEIYGAYDAEIDDRFACRLGQAVGTRLAGGRLVVGGDVRASTAPLKRALIEGARSTGCEVYDVGILPTPVLYFAKDRLWADGAVMVTGSHHSVEENGFSITLGKLPTTKVELDQIEESIANEGPFASGAGQLYLHDTVKPYQSFLVAQFVPADPLDVVVDANNGSMSDVALSTLLLLGYRVLDCRCSASEDFGGQTPDPFLPENLGALSRSVLTRQAQLGVAYDGDGDQVVFADEQGTILTPAQTLILLSRALLVYQPGSLIVYDQSFAPYVAEEIRKVGGTPMPLRAGTVGIKRTLLEQGAVLGADARGHYFFRTMGGDDALYATLVMLRIASRYDGALQPIVGSLTRNG
jgi:phosphomannomutase/phosphoglucomutase